MPVEKLENPNAARRPILFIAALVFISIAMSSSSAGFALVASVACFGVAYSASCRLSQSASVFTLVIAFFGLMATFYSLWCCWVISSSPNYWPRPFPYPDTVIDWMHSRLNPITVSPFGNKRLLLAFGGMSALSAGFSGWVTACLLNQKNSVQTKLNAPTTAFYVRCIFGSAAGFFFGFFPALIVSKGAVSGSPLLSLAILVASTLLGGFVGSRSYVDR